MHPLLKRILIHGALTASILAVMGYGLTELARIWLVTQTPTRAQPGAPSTGTADDANLGRVPLVMAGWGVAFVVVGECLMWAVRGRKEYAAKRAAAAAPATPDPAEVLLEQLLREAEAKQAAADTSPLTAGRDNSPG